MKYQPFSKTSEFKNYDLYAMRRRV